MNSPKKDAGDKEVSVLPQNGDAADGLGESTETHEIITGPPEIMTETLDIVTGPSEIVTGPPEIDTEPPEIVTETPEIVMGPPESVTETPDIVTGPPAIVTEPPEIVTEMDEVPDGGWGWVVAGGTFFIIFFTGGLLKSGGVLYLKFLDRFGENALTTAWVFSLHSTVHLLPAPIASGLTERYSPRGVVFFGTFLAFVGMLASAFVPTIYPLYLTFSVVVGFGKCLIYTASLIVISQFFNKKRGIATGIASAGGGVGVMFFPPFIEWLFTVYSYQGAMLIMAGITTETFVCGALFRSIEKHRRLWRASQRRIQKAASEHQEVTKLLSNDTNDEPFETIHENTFEILHDEKTYLNSETIANKENTSPEKETAQIVQNGTTRKRSPSAQKNIRDHLTTIKSRLLPKKKSKKKAKLLDVSLLRDFVFLTLCLGIFSYTMSMFITLVFIPPLAKSKGISEVKASWIVSIMGLSDTTARILAGFIFDMKCIKPYRLIVYNGVLFGLSVVSMVIPMAESFLGFCVVAVAFGVLMGCYTSQKTVVVVDVIGTEKMAASFGLLLLFQGLGSLVGPTISGLFKDVFGGYDEGFYLGGIGLFCGASLFMCGNIYRIVQARRKKPEQETT